MRQGVVCAVLLPAVMLMGLVGGSVEAATSCVLPDASPHTPFWYSNAGTASCSDRMFNMFVFDFGIAATKSQLVAVVGCDIQIYNLDGIAPQPGVRYSPWSASWGAVNYPHNTHRLRHVALLEGFPYGMASYSTEGWALFKWTAGPNGAVTGFSNTDHFKLATQPSSGATEMLGTKMWWGLDGHAYIVGRYLEKQDSITAFKIADMGTGGAAPPLTIKADLPQKSGTSLFDVVRVGNQILLLQWGAGGLHVYDVSDPSSPAYLGKTAAAHVNTMGSTDFGPLRVWGPAVVNKGTPSNPNWRGYVVSSSGTKLYIVDLNDPTSPSKLAEVTIPAGGAVKSIDSDGKLVVINQDPLVDNAGNLLDLPKARYYSVDADTFVEIPSHVNWYPHTGDADEQPQDVALLPGSTQYRTFRSAILFAYQDTVEASCLSTIPTASLSVTRVAGMPGAPSCSAPTGAVKGFPGDDFVLSNQSSSGTTLEELVITGPNQYYMNVTGSMLGGSMTWTSPSNEVGTFTLTLSVRDAAQILLTDTVTVFLCNDPVARLMLTHVKAPGGSWQTCSACSWLQGYGLRFSTLSSDGHPGWTSTNPTWTVQLCPTGAGCAPSTDFVNNLNGTMELTLAGTGDYKVSAGVAYPFLELPKPTTETTVHSGAVTAAFTAAQGSNTIGPGGAMMIGSALNLTFTGQVASGSTAMCSWALTPNAWSSANVPCANGATIPANTLTNGQQYTLQLTAVSSPAVDQAVASLVFNATDISGSFSWTPNSIDIGSLVSFMGEGLPPNVQKARWSFGESGCNASYPSVIEGVCTLGCVSGFRFKSAGTKTVTLAISMDGTSYTTIASQQLTVNSSGTCPTTCTGPGTPNNTSPKNTTVPAGPVTFQWTSVSGTSPISYTVNVGGMPLCSSTGTSCTTGADMVAGDYTWTVRASNSCGAATSAATNFTVGSACTLPSTPSNTSPTNGATVPAGNVTFSWTAASGSPTPVYDVYLGALTKLGSNISGTSLTVAVPNGTWQWSVTAKNSCGNRSSTAYSLTVGTPCVAPGQPTNPTPANNGVVQPGNVTLSWSAPATGNSLTYDVFVGGLKACSSITATQCVVPNVTSGTRTWYVQAKNSCGTGTSATWSFSICQATAVPVASFTWTPKESVTIGGVLQDQPYVGQAVTFDPSLTTNFPTSFEWTDFSQAPWATYTVANPTHTWQTPGDKIVRMKATNCIGTSAQVPLTVKVYPDIRPVLAGFTSSVTDPLNPQVLTFTAATGSANGDPNHFTWDFGDGETAAGSDKGEVVHTFKCGATFTVKLTSRRMKSGSDVRSQPTTKDIPVGGSSCSPYSLMVMDVARNLPGNNGAMWNTDLTIYNPTENNMTLIMAIKKPDSTPRDESARPFTLLPGETRDLNWVLSAVERDFTKATLWFYQSEPINRGLKPLPIISARTHTGAVAPYDDFGQFVMVYPVYQATTRKLTLYFTGIRHNGKTAQAAGQGFRTNLTLVEPAGIGWGSQAVKLTLTKVDDPSFVKERQLWASGKYGYWQKSIDTLFTGLTPEDDLGRLILKVEIEPGAAIALGSSLVNNYSNAPVFVPAQEAP
jgi:hypothetical protein